MAEEVHPSKALLQRLREKKWEVVQAWRDEQEQETNLLEFKLKGTLKPNEIDDEDRDNLAQSLSAFANTEGGLLVLGVYAGSGTRKGGFDRVQHIAEVANLEKFAGAVERRLRTFTEPPIAALEVVKVENPEKSDSGVVAIFVPPSAGGPHHASNASTEVNGRYYMRTASGAQTMPHSLLATLFGRPPHPDLELRVRVAMDGRPRVTFRLINHGRGSARDPRILLTTKQKLEWSGQQQPVLWESEAGETHILFEVNRELFPGMEFPVAAVGWMPDNATDRPALSDVPLSRGGVRLQHATSKRRRRCIER